MSQPFTCIDGRAGLNLEFWAEQDPNASDPFHAIRWALREGHFLMGKDITRREVYSLKLANPDATAGMVNPVFHVRKTIVLTYEEYARLVEGKNYQELRKRLSAAGETEPARDAQPRKNGRPGPRGIDM